jgi:hypothetical protein
MKTPGTNKTKANTKSTGKKTLRNNEKNFHP